MATSLPPAYPPLVASIDTLTPIHIKDLKLNTHHRENYLLVRVLTVPFADHILFFVIEDETGVASDMRFCFYHATDDGSQWRALAQRGDIFLIKQPYLFILNTDVDYTIRIDHQSDVVRLEPGHKRIPAKWRTAPTDQHKSADDWKQAGNKAFGEREYWLAIR